MRYTVDRIEGLVAVCEQPDRTMVNIPLHALPFTVKEGTAFEFEEGVYTLVNESDRKRRISKMMDDLWN